MRSLKIEKKQLLKKYSFHDEKYNKSKRKSYFNNIYCAHVPHLKSLI